LGKVEVGKIRNITLIGHGGAGKTSVAEALLYKAGVTSRPGSVDQGSSIFDSDPEEIKRKISINLSMAHFEWDGKFFNLIDTPGYLDFMGEVKAALRISDNAVVVINAAAGIEVGTEKYWEFAEERKIPRFIFINKCKSPEINLDSVLSEIREAFGTKVVPFQVPKGTGENFKGVIDLFPSPPSEEGIEKASESLKESIIELSEELLDKYLSGEEIPDRELEAVLREGIRNCEIFPVLYGDATSLVGIEELLKFLANYSVSPEERPREKAKKDGKEEELSDDELALLVFKTVTEPHLGEIYYVRVFSGLLSYGVEVLNSTLGRSEKINQIFLIRGKERKETEALSRGMLGALVKLKETKTGHTLASKEKPVELQSIEFPEPSISVAIVPKTREDEEKVSEALTKLSSEDPTFKFHYDPELKQTIISGMGELHLDVIVSKLRGKFGVEVRTERPKVPYRETIRKTATAMGKYVKQTGGRGQYGICYIRIEPLKRGEGYEFINDIFGGAIPSSFIPSVETGIKKAMQSGILAGYPVVDVKVTLYDGKYHPVDSSNIAFEIAGSMAFKDAQKNAEPYLLEPIYEVEVLVPEENMGDVIGDLNARRGKILGMESEGRLQKIKALVPLAEMYKYSSTLRSITKGRGTFTMKFSHYDEVPKEIERKIIQEAKRQKEEEK